jgi:N4-(beta-N-acetylglucosaminyl)-L-asparaginase
VTLPLVINTWHFKGATDTAWAKITGGGSKIDAVVAGCSYCEDTQCDGSVGYGGAPDENGETTLDALVVDGTTMDVGAVSALRNVKHAIKVARAIMDYTTHTMLAGDQATQFAVMMGFTEQSLETPESQRQHQDWMKGNCQPNWRVNVVPDPTKSCGPYSPASLTNSSYTLIPEKDVVREKVPGHDTISMVVMDKNGRFAAGTSTNGKTWKVPGRVGDGPIMGSGSYAMDGYGGCGATGDGDVLMRFLPCVHILEYMRQGMSPTLACETALRKIPPFYPNFQGAVLAVNTAGQYGAAAYGWTFTYSVRSADMPQTQMVVVPPFM